jgi:hypothetical protein
MRLKPIVAACVLAGIALLVHAFRLTATPITPEEAEFNRQAHSIRAGATPLFFHAGDIWLQPAAVYANAAVATIGGDDVSGRVASAIAASINVGLVFLIAQLVTGRAWVGIVAGGILLLTPAHWWFATLGTDSILPVPLILAWLWGTLRFFHADKGLAVAAAALGLSVYTHPAAPLTAAFLWALTIIIARRRNVMRLLAATAVFALAWLPAAAWFFRHPADYADTFGRWFVFAAHLRFPLDGVRAFFNPGTLGNRASLYWGFWDPSWLFFTREQLAAPLLIVTAPLIAIGALRCARRTTRETAALLIGTALIVPLAGASFGVPRQGHLSAAAAVLPVLAVLSALGVDQLVSRVIRRSPLEDEKAVPAAEGWDADHLMPRS